MSTRQEQWPWWKTAVIYQIYPISFQDSNNDGYGDLEGIRSQIDYLVDLGVDAIWLNPINPSAMMDFGYDVLLHTGINPIFGNEVGFDRLVDDLHSRDIKLVLDFVPNYTSDKHPWFIESRSSQDNPKADWFVWAGGRKGVPPNHWGSMFGGSAWQWDEIRRQYYYHKYLKEMPTLNWHNPEVRKVMYDAMRYWLDRGVDGFRLDSINEIIVDKHLRENPIELRPDLSVFIPYFRQKHLYDEARPESFEIVREMRRLIDSYPDRMNLGEVGHKDVDLIVRYLGGKRADGLHLATNFDFFFQPWKAQYFRLAVERVERFFPSTCWPAYGLSNHDYPRHISRYTPLGNQAKGMARARVAAMMLLTLRGTPLLYYGEEIGMQQQRVPRRFLRDMIGKRFWPLYRGRDGCRTPMRWSHEPYAGFSKILPWMPVGIDKNGPTVEGQKQDSCSLLNLYRDLIRLRKKKKRVLQTGSYQCLDAPAGVFAYERLAGASCLVVALNFTGFNRYFSLPRRGKLLLSTIPGRVYEGKKISLSPNEGCILEILE